MKDYSLKQCEDLISRYVNERSGAITQIEDGCLGLGFLILHDAPKTKTIIIKEYYINAWCSGHKVTMYNEIPKKYQELIRLTEEL